MDDGVGTATQNAKRKTLNPENGKVLASADVKEHAKAYGAEVLVV